MRALSPFAALAAVLVAVAPLPASPADFTDSPLTDQYPPAPPCDLLLTPSNISTTKRNLNDADKRVFCLAPGDYRVAGVQVLSASGNQNARRYLRFPTTDGYRNAAQRTQRAILESLRITGNWWVIEQVTIMPTLTAGTGSYVHIQGGDHNTLDGNLIDGGAHGNVSTTTGIKIGGNYGDPATYNHVQGNVIRNGNMTRRDVDYFGVLVRPGDTPTEANDNNYILDNEISDWGDGVAIGGHTTDCSEPARQHGTVVDGNDIYLTSAKRANCATGAWDPNGECACAENAIDTKSDPGNPYSWWTQITNNRIWGYRPTPEGGAATCGGSGSNGQAITGGNECAGHTLIARNMISDSVTGIQAVGPSWLIVGNLVHDIRAVSGGVYWSAGINATPYGSDLRIEFNTIVDTDTAYDNSSSDTRTRCNVVVNDLDRMTTGQPQGANHLTLYNYLYDGSTSNFPSSSNVSFSSASASQNETYCYWRKRWTGKEQVCVPWAASTAMGPHVAALAQCDPWQWTSEFDLPPAPWVTAHACADGADNDGDGDGDSPADLGCANALASAEDPSCQNGLDDDGDGRIDYDGGRVANGGTQLAQPDLECTSPHRTAETPGCGLGFEAGVALALIGQRRRKIG
jgi:hypothetical protein